MSFQEPSTRGRIVNWLLFLAVLVVSFVTGEWLLRTLPVSDRMGWNLISSLEERVKAAGPKVEQRTRILVLGDSFAEWRDTTGDNLARIAEGRLREHNESLDLINLGQGGTGPFDYFSNVVRYGERVNPDLVVFAIYLGNDLVASPWAIGSDASVEAALREPLPDSRRNGGYLLKQSVALNYLFRLAKQFIPPFRSHSFEDLVARLQQQTGRDNGYVSRRLAEADPSLVEAARADAINSWDLAVAIFFPAYYGDLAAAGPRTPAGRSVDGFLTDLAGVLAYCRERGYDVAAVLIPPSVWVSDRYHSYFHRLGYTDLGPVSGNVPVVERVKAALEDQGVPTLDLLPILRSAREDVFIENDIHFNRRGHQVAGQALAQLLVDAGLLRDRGS